MAQNDGSGQTDQVQTVHDPEPPPEDATIYQRLDWFRQNFPGVKKSSYNPFHDSYYTSLDDLKKAIDPYLTAAGLTYIQTIIGNTLWTFIFEPDSQSSLSFDDDPLATSGCIFSKVEISPEKPTSQSFVSDSTYKRRTSLATLLSVVESGDDDGNTGRQLADNKKSASKAVKLMQNVGQGPAATLKYWLKLGGWRERKDVFNMLDNHDKGTLRKALLEARMSDQTDPLSEYTRLIFDYVERDDAAGMKELSQEMEIDEKYAVFLELPTDLSTAAKGLTAKKI